MNWNLNEKQNKNNCSVYIGYEFQDWEREPKEINENEKMSDREEEEDEREEEKEEEKSIGLSVREESIIHLREHFDSALQGKVGLIEDLVLF